MSVPPLYRVVEAVIGRAQRQGTILPVEIQEELVRAGLPDQYWEEVVDLARPALRQHDQHYRYVTPGVNRLRSRARADQRHQRAVLRTLRTMVRTFKLSLPKDADRRGERRYPFIQPVQIHLEGEDPDTPLVLHCVTRDVSRRGIRLLGSRPLMGRRIRIRIPVPGMTEAVAWAFTVQVLWTAPMGDQLFENGCMFLDVLEAPPV